MAARDALPGHFSCLKGKSVQFARVGPPPVRPGGGFRSRRLIWQLPETTLCYRGIPKGALVVMKTIIGALCRFLEE